MSSFLNDVLTGLSQTPKRLPSKYFYNERGSALFSEIMSLPEYYLTRSETEILSNQSNQIWNALSLNRPLRIIEFGAGNGEKTLFLLRALQEINHPFIYMPVDISEDALNHLAEKLHQELENITIQPVCTDYHTFDRSLLDDWDTQNIIFYLGSNIGNYEFQKAEQLLSTFQSYLHPGDALLLGVDLQKNPHTIQNAYSDSKGITKEFNLTLIHRMKDELRVNVDPKDFDFYSTYNPLTGSVQSFLISLKKQSLFFPDVSKTITLQKNEVLYTELSQKYTTEQLEVLAHKSGFEVNTHFLDSKEYFTDTLLIKR